MTSYEPEIERQMRTFYESLSEKDRRRYAAVEVGKLPFGGVTYIASVLGCDANTIRHGERDIEQLPFDEADGRVRKKGADVGAVLIACQHWNRM
jgi:hypothetical protein